MYQRTVAQTRNRVALHNHEWLVRLVGKTTQGEGEMGEHFAFQTPAFLPSTFLEPLLINTLDF